MQCKPVTQQVCTRNTHSCSVYNMIQLLFDNDGCVGNSCCHNLPPSMNDASDSWLFSAWNAQNFTSGWQAISAAVCYLLLNMWVSFIMITLCWYLLGTCNTSSLFLYMRVYCAVPYLISACMYRSELYFCSNSKGFGWLESKKGSVSSWRSRRHGTASRGSRRGGGEYLCCCTRTRCKIANCIQYLCLGTRTRCKIANCVQYLCLGTRTRCKIANCVQYLCLGTRTRCKKANCVQYLCLGTEPDVR